MNTYIHYSLHIYIPVHIASKLRPNIPLAVSGGFMVLYMYAFAKNMHLNEIVILVTSTAAKN